MDIQQRIDELEPLAFHNVPVRTLMKYCDPLQCWPELQSPITKDEVLACVQNGGSALTQTPLMLELSFSDEPLDLPLLRENHVRKIAYFVENEPVDSIGLDVGMPNMGCHVDYFLQDGNHRFAGSIVAGRETVRCQISGSEEYMRELGLWHPNEAYLELMGLLQVKYGGAKYSQSV